MLDRTSYLFEYDDYAEQNSMSIKVYCSDMSGIACGWLVIRRNQLRKYR